MRLCEAAAFTSLCGGATSLMCEGGVKIHGVADIVLGILVGGAIVVKHIVGLERDVRVE